MFSDMKSTDQKKKTVRTHENIERARTAFQQSPTWSANRHALILNLSNRSQRRILHFQLSFHTYKMQVVQQLNANDKLNRSKT
ncbi:hypothetical protein C0J52_26684 [Blattella germanica]|nr:hypothetical protein C0J52_26684 [Blattella germanica]